MVPTVTILAVFAMALRFSIGPDTYWHLRAGDWILTEGSLLKVDPFSLTRFGSEWIYPGWLAQIALIAAYQLLGFPGLNLLTALVVAAAFGFLWSTMQGRPLLRAFVLLLAATSSAVYWSARPHIFTFLFTAATLWGLAKFWRDGSRVIWVLPVLTAVWANVHGGFVIPILLIGLELLAGVIGLLLPKLRIAISGTGGDRDLDGDGAPITGSGNQLAAARVGERSRMDPGDAIRDLAPRSAAEPDRNAGRLKTLAGVGLASAAAIVINPFGLDMFGYPLRTLSIGVLQDFIQEWQSPNFHQIEVQPFLWLLLLVLAATAISPKRPTAIELVHVGLFAYLGFLAARNIALFALVAAPVLSRHLNAILSKWLPPRSSKQELPARLTRPLNGVLLALIAFAAFVKGALPLSSQFNEKTIAENMPARAVDYIRVNRPEGPLWNSYNWGGYVLWRLYPEYLSFVDGRTDLFDDAILEEYLDVWRGRDGWQEVLDRWRIRTVLVERDAPLVRELLSEGWIEVYADDQASVFTGPN
ncbi:MAG: hypothetical protein J4N76_08945 [Chloroflexi bacterium]|nr:hypothetical protein [Chloroflexota bacterium]MDK1044117.1 hypothetical protein [Anaerolineales bacterium]MCI0772562.1 hypothetical protein [Chloroflexota bacterium]MCI0807098.1 hypothetical protein [Chloroflexota bacterium]MCI0827907.1 hypothetical protein [Chloroflexota bacterium]